MSSKTASEEASFQGKHQPKTTKECDDTDPAEKYIRKCYREVLHTVRNRQGEAGLMQAVCEKLNALVLAVRRKYDP